MTPSRSRRTGYALLIAAGIGLFAELGAYLALRYVDGAAFSVERIRGEQRAIAGIAVAASDVDAPVPRGLEYLAKHVAHPYLGFVRDPTGEEPGFIPVNEWGFADYAPPFHERSADRVIVGIVGGSVARNFGFRGAEAFAEAISASGPYAGREVVFVRLGLGGYKQPQQLQTVSYLLALGASFDVIVNLDGFNEVALHEQDNGLRGVYPAFPRAWSFRAQRFPDAATQVAMGRVAELRDRRRRWAEAFAGSALGRSALANLVWRTQDARLNAAITRGEEALRRRESSARSYLETGPRLSVESDAELYAALVEIWRGSSLQLARLCRANGIAYFHFLQPNQYVADSKPMGAAERRIAVPEKSRYRKGVALGYPRLRGAGARLTEAGVAFADLTRAFRDVEEPIYEDDCCHISAAGHEILARAMAAFIAETATTHPDLFAPPVQPANPDAPARPTDP